ncbi:MAG TPA: primosomal protein N' [Acidobacteriaceae bacterium]|nr:primosomal protein N' [Acidobacteriaceae bacterium]
MPTFCDVALPVPLDRTFTYRLRGPEPAELGLSPEGAPSVGMEENDPPVGGRVVVSFRNTKLVGIVTRLHDEPPPVEAKPVDAVLDREPILTAELMELARWIAQYYFAPLGEVLRTMLPLMAEVRRKVLYRITETGRAVLFAGAEQGSSRRSRRSPEDQDAEYTVLNYLSDGESSSRTVLRRATGVTGELLANMVRKKWLASESEAEPRDARRLLRYAVLVADARPPRLNENQLTILAELAGAGGSMALPDLRRLQVPSSTLATLVKRGLVNLEDRPAAFHLSGISGAAHAATLKHTLSQAQEHALATILSTLESDFAACLLHGVTGSGKTAVYLAAMQKASQLGLGAILLVPEIGLTPAMAGQLYAAFGGDVALLHSQLTPDERAEQWRRIRRGEARIVVGTRSAIFAPVENLGLLIVDEEHDSSYKQEEVPRYHGRDVAVMRAKINRATVVLGSATPSLESWYNAEKKKYRLIELKERVQQRPLPVIDLVDMRREFQETGQERIFSRALAEETQATLERGEQAIILLNRRGYSFAVLCRACGEKLQCENCAIALTYHRAIAPQGGQGAPPNPSGQRLKCHYCGYIRTVPNRCPECDSEHLFYLGAGSQQGEERLQELFPGARIGRMDRDTVRNRHDMERLLAQLHSGEINLLVGTQMIAKGHDIHGVTLVGVAGADYALGLPDFRAAERVFQLLTQVSGRAGRGALPGQVLVQTYHPEHYAVQCAAQHDFQGFVRRELQYRKWMRYPPFAVLANLLIHSQKMEEAAAWAVDLGKALTGMPLEGVRVLGPAAAPIARIKRTYRFHLLLKAELRQALAQALRTAIAQAEALGIPRRNLVVDVDPVNLM